MATTRWAGAGMLVGLMLGACTGGQSGTPSSAKGVVDGAARTHSLGDGGVQASSSGDAGCERGLSDVEAIRDQFTGRYSGEAAWEAWSDAETRHYRDGTTEYELVLEEAGDVWRTNREFEAPVRITLRTQDGRMNLEGPGHVAVPKYCEFGALVSFATGELGSVHGIIGLVSGNPRFRIGHPDDTHLTLVTVPEASP